MNHTIIAGRLGTDPEERYTSNGQKVISLRVATNTRKAGKDETIWWQVVVWGNQFDKMIAYLKKGSPIICMGELQKPEIYTDREGKPQVAMSLKATSLQFSPFGRSSDGQESPGKQQVASSMSSENTQKPQAEPFDSMAHSGHDFSATISDDEIPF